MHNISVHMLVLILYSYPSTSGDQIKRNSVPA